LADCGTQTPEAKAYFGEEHGHCEPGWKVLIVSASHLLMVLSSLLTFLVKCGYVVKAFTLRKCVLLGANTLTKFNHGQKRKTKTTSACPISGVAK
jgi:hypothetical protein